MGRAQLRWDPASQSDPGFCIDVLISNSRQVTEAGRAIGLEYPEPLQVRALLDTGASVTVISKTLANYLKLLETNVGTASVVPARPPSGHRPDGHQYDVFICHASEDKRYVEMLESTLRVAGISVWFDRTCLEWGDDLRSAIDRGVKNCRYGIVVFSKAFLAKKKWTEYELSSLFAREAAGKKIILPIWHGIARGDLLEYGPGIADRLAMVSVPEGAREIVGSLKKILGHSQLDHGEPDLPAVAAGLGPGSQADASRFGEHGGIEVSVLGATIRCGEYAGAVSFPGTDLRPFDPLRLLSADFVRQPNFACLIGRDILRNWGIAFDGRRKLVTIED